LKRSILAIIAAFALAACTPPVETVIQTERPNVHAVDSAWRIVAEATIGARALDTAEALEAEAAAYNAAHTDDQWTVIYGEVPPIELSPSADAYIVYADTHEIIEEYHGIERADLTERRDQWRRQTDSYGTAILYVDNIPPPPVVIIDTRSDYEKYALYLIAADGSIIFEEHLTDASYYATIDAHFADRLDIYQRQARLDGNGEYVISGAIYTPPEAP